MAKPNPDAAWRAWLSPEELLEVADAEEQIAFYREQIEPLRGRIHVIRNRHIHKTYRYGKESA